MRSKGGVIDLGARDEVIGLFGVAKFTNDWTEVSIGLINQ